MPRQLLSIGECMVEFAPSQKPELFHQGFAGDAFNTAWHFQRHAGRKWQTSFFTAIGDDAMSAQMLEFIKAAAINVEHIQVLPEKCCGLYTITLEGAERSFSYWRGQSAAKHLADNDQLLETALFAASDVYFSGITLAILDASARKRLLLALGRAKSAGKSVTFDPNIRMRLWANQAEAKKAILSAAKISTRVMPSFDDERQLFGDTSPEVTCARYTKLGASEIIIKDSVKNVLVAANGFVAEVPAIKVKKPVDTTGAGDAFNAGYLAARLNGFSAISAAKFGHAVAADVILGRGALVPANADLQALRNA